MAKKTKNATIYNKCADCAHIIELKHENHKGDWICGRCEIYPTYLKLLNVDGCINDFKKRTK